MTAVATMPVVEAPETVEPAAEKTELVHVSGIAGKIIESEGFGLLAPKLDGLDETARKSAIRQYAKDAVTAEDRIKLVAAELLYEVGENKYWKEWTTKDPDTGEERPYNTFDEYVETELGMARRQALYLTRIYEVFVVKLALSPTVLKDIQWSKAKEVTGFIDTGNVEEVLEVLRDPDMTVKKISEWVKSRRAGIAGPVAGAEGEAPAEGGVTADASDKPTVKMTFKVTEEQSQIITTAIDLAKNLADSDVPGNCLALICGDFLGSASATGVEGALQRIDHILKSLEAAYGIKVTITDHGTLEERAQKEAVAAASA